MPQQYLNTIANIATIITAVSDNKEKVQRGVLIGGAFFLYLAAGSIGSFIHSVGILGVGSVLTTIGAITVGKYLLFAVNRREFFSKVLGIVGEVMGDELPMTLDLPDQQVDGVRATVPEIGVPINRI